MNLLTEEYWSLFDSDGSQFEHLVKALLELEYRGKTFRITPASHDGARDIETEIPLLDGINAEIWAECKYRSKRLPIHQVAMTLVMAYIENARGILFFSYSPVNRTFHSYLSQFRDRSGIAVKVFDDCALESLILKHKEEEKIQSFFPDFPWADETVLRQRGEYSCLSVNYDVFQNGKKIKCHDPQMLPYAALTDKISLWITVRNRNSRHSIAPIISLPNIAKNQDFIFLTSKLKDKSFQKELFLSPGEVCGFRFDFRIKRFCGILTLPKMTIAWEDDKKDLHPGRLQGRWLAEAPLIGQDFYAVLESQRQGMRSSQSIVSQIKGKSGVGKSRLLKEILLQATAEGKKTFFWDADFQKGNHVTFMQSMISSLEGLPLLQKSGKKGSFLAEEQAPARRLLAAQFLYKRNALSHCPLQDLAAYFATLMREKEVWIVLDNVQNYDERTLETLDHLVDILQEQKSGSGLVLAFNEDFLFEGTKADRFMQRVLTLSGQRPAQYQTYVLHDLNRAEALEYLRACLDSPLPGQSPVNRESFAKALEMLVDRWGTRPFYLQHVLLYLEQQHVLTRTERSGFFISDIAAFWNHIQALPPTLDALLERRTNCVLESLTDREQENCRQVFSLLTISNPIPADICRGLFGEFLPRKRLIQAGILSEDPNGTLSLYHQYFNQFFQKAYPFHEMQESFWRQIISVAEQRRAVSDLLIPVVLAQYFLGERTESYYKKLLKRLTTWQIDAKVSPYLLPVLANMLDRDIDTMPMAQFLRCYHAICFMTADREGIDRACVFYERLLRHFTDDPQRFSRQFEMLFLLLREYVISLNNMNCNRTGLGRLDTIDNGIQAMRLSEKKRQRYASTLDEIRCMIHYWIADTKQAVEDARRSIAEAGAGEVPWQKLSALREFGYTYYYAPDAASCRKQMCHQWDLGYQLYFQLEKSGPSREGPHGLQPYIATHLVSAIADMSRLDLESAGEKVVLLSEYLDKTGMPFYELKLRLLRAEYLLLNDFQRHRTLVRQEEVHRLIQQATDQCVIYYDMQDYPNCFYLQALAYMLSGSCALAEDSFLKTCFVLRKLMIQRKEAVQVERVWGYFYQDMALCLRRMGRPIPEHVISGIHTREIREAVVHIQKCSDRDIQLMWQDRSAVTAVTDADRQWNFPKI